MRLFLIAALLSAQMAPLAVAQAPAPEDRSGSLLGPRMPEALPPPTPVVPQAEPMRAVPDQGLITATPLPPPGAAPPPAPALLPPSAAVTSSPAVAPSQRAPVGALMGAPVGAPVSLTPIPLSLPPLSRPPAFEKPASPNAKTGVPSSIVARLPAPALSDEASPGDFLRAARGALAAGRNGEARSALEMAQTRLLSRVVDAGKESEPSDNTAVKQISEALTLLAANDRMGCLRYIEFASRTIGSPLD